MLQPASPRRAMTKSEGYTKRMERQLAGWKTRFETDRGEAQKLGASLGADERGRLEAAKVAGDAAFEKFAELRAAARRWVELRVEMERLWQALEPGALPEAEPAPR